MAEELEIKCGTGEDAYTVILTGAHANILELVKGSPAVKDKKGKSLEGEDLVAAIMTMIPYGISSIKRLNNDGQLNDGPHGEYAVQEFKNGNPVFLGHLKNGKKNDAPDGEAAVQRFDDDGNLTVERYQDDVANDGPNGEPYYDRKSFKYAPLVGKMSTHAISRMKNGEANDGLHGEPALIVSVAGYVIVEHYREGKNCNGANGEPGIQKFRHGSLVEAWQIKDNGKKKALGSFARRKAQKKFKLSPPV